MSLDKQYEKIKEERTIEAIRNNLMGNKGKIALICHVMGKPILSQGYGDMGYREDEGCFTDVLLDIPIMDDYHLDEQGMIWDGLNMGIHMEIKIDNYRREILCNYKGYPVYQEIGGELKLYAPKHPLAGEWEHHVDKVYQQAKILRKKEIISEHELEEAEKPHMVERILDFLKMRWGE